MEPAWGRSRKKQFPYTHRRPEETPLYRVIYHYRDEFERRWDELFEEKYGTLRREVLEAFLLRLSCYVSQ